LQHSTAQRSGVILICQLVSLSLSLFLPLSLAPLQLADRFEKTFDSSDDATLKQLWAGRWPQASVLNCYMVALALIKAENKTSRFSEHQVAALWRLLKHAAEKRYLTRAQCTCVDVVASDEALRERGLDKSGACHAPRAVQPPPSHFFSDVRMHAPSQTQTRWQHMCAVDTS
jgi:hypothetical protein